MLVVISGLPFHSPFFSALHTLLLSIPLPGPFLYGNSGQEAPTWVEVSVCLSVSVTCIWVGVSVCVFVCVCVYVHVNMRVGGTHGNSVSCLSIISGHHDKNQQMCFFLLHGFFLHCGERTNAQLVTQRGAWKLNLAPSTTRWQTSVFILNVGLNTASREISAISVLLYSYHFCFSVEKRQWNTRAYISHLHLDTYMLSQFR